MAGTTVERRPPLDVERLDRTTSARGADTARNARSLIASLALVLLVYLSTPFVAILSPLGIADALAAALATIAVAHVLLTLPRHVAAGSAALAVLGTVVFNLASRPYFEQQQTFLSIHTLYLVGELPGLLRAQSIATLATATALAATLYTALLWASDLSRHPRARVRAGRALVLVVAALGAQLAYARVADEARARIGDTAPLGHITRSTGLVPFVKPDIEVVAARERQAVLRSLRDHPHRPLPARYRRSSLAPLIGHSVAADVDVENPRYPLYRTRAASGASPDGAPLSGSNVLIVVLESVRSAEMGAYGADHTSTPFLDSLAARHTIAPRFYATSNFTVKSEHAIHCSTLDYLKGAPVATRDAPVRTRCLPARLRDAGYRTLWFHGNTKNFYDRDAYLPRIGFEEIWSRDELDPEGRLPALGWGLTDPVVFDAALDRLEALDEPFYAEILTLSNHLPFDYDWDIDFPADLAADATMHERYRRGMYYTDRAVARFHERFSRSGLAANTILVITGDHGIWSFPSEELGELQKNEMLFRVPLIVQAPGKGPSRIETAASHLDIAPTLVDLLGLDGPDDSLGRSLLPPTRDDGRILYQMTEHALSYRQGRRVCVPSVQCENDVGCRRTHDASTSEMLCYRLSPSQDPLDDPKATLLDRDSLRAARDRTLFDYTQMALELGTSPPAARTAPVR